MLTLNPFGLTHRVYSLRVLEYALLFGSGVLVFDLASQLHEFTSGPDCFGRSYWALPETTDFKITSGLLLTSFVAGVSVSMVANRSRPDAND